MALPGWSENDSNRCTEISKLAEIIVSLNCQLHLERKRCDELENDNFLLRNKLFCQKYASHLSEPCGKPSTVNDTSETGVHNAVGKIQPQWDLCLEERRKKYEQHTINTKLNKTRTSPKTMSTLKSDDKERSDVLSSANNKTVRKPGALKKAFDKSQKHNYRGENLTGRKQSTYTPSKTTTKPHDNESQENLDKENHVCKKGTVLIMSDSILQSLPKVLGTPIE